MNKNLVQTILGATVDQVHQIQKDAEKGLSLWEKTKVRLAKKTNWAVFISLGFAIAEKNPVDIIDSVGVIVRWFF